MVKRLSAPNEIKIQPAAPTDTSVLWLDTDDDSAPSSGGSNAGIVIDEMLSGLINSTNSVFTTAKPFTSISVKKNGVQMHIGDDFTITGTNQITFVSPPAASSVAKVTADYVSGELLTIDGTNSLIFKEFPVESANGTRTTFTVQKGKYVPGTLKVFIGAGYEGRGVVETNPSIGTFTLDYAWPTGTSIEVEYMFSTGASGNADTVDGIHANTSPTAGNLFPLDSNAKIPLAVNTSRVRRELGLAFRDNTQKTVSAVGDTWYNIRNSADTADLSVTFTTTQPKFYVDFSLVIWSGSNRYKHVRLLLDGSTTGVAPAEWSASYLLNGVAPGAGLFEVTAAPGSHTITFQAKLLGAGNEALEYRGGFIRAYEVIA